MSLPFYGIARSNPRTLFARVGSPVAWPVGKRFAFSIVDDTDRSTVENTKPVYDLLREHGILTTKTVWPLSPTECGAIFGGDSLEHRDYRDWVVALKASGFEIGFHGAADQSSTRQRTIQALQYFRHVFGEYPSIHTTHSGQQEALYWGAGRFDAPVRWIYHLARQEHGAGVYSGAVENSPYFWADWAPKYVRNFVFHDINTLKMDPLMPYHDPRRPLVQNWFSSSQGSNLNSFCRLISEENQDRLESEGGACIVYTHLGSGFYPLREDFKRLIYRLAAKPGWFVPASTLLDYLAARRGFGSTRENPFRFQQMQLCWLMQQGLRKLKYRSKEAPEFVDRVAAFNPADVNEITPSGGSPCVAERLQTE
jgi:hypothetical protein